MGNWRNSNEAQIYYRDKEEHLTMSLIITTDGRKIYREDIEKVIEYLEDKKYDFEMNI